MIDFPNEMMNSLQRLKVSTGISLSDRQPSLSAPDDATDVVAFGADVERAGCPAACQAGHDDRPDPPACLFHNLKLYSRPEKTLKIDIRRMFFHLC